jgi:hypothetical protein
VASSVDDVDIYSLRKVTLQDLSNSTGSGMVDSFISVHILVQRVAAGFHEDPDDVEMVFEGGPVERGILAYLSSYFGLDKGVVHFVSSDVVLFSLCLFVSIV